jgi:hypothetical protein
MATTSTALVYHFTVAHVESLAVQARLSQTHYVNRQLLEITRQVARSRCRKPAYLSHPLAVGTPLYWLKSQQPSLDITVAPAKLHC